MKEYFKNLNSEDFINELPTHLREPIVVLNQRGLEYEQIGVELSANPSFGLAAKGGVRWDNELFARILNELKIMICKDEPRYEKIKKEMKSEGSITSKIVIAVLSGYVSDLFGLASSICVPFIILGIAAILKAGLEAVCATVL